jgi:hypothetical protein
METKYILFLLAMAAGVPLGVAACLAWKPLSRLVAAVMVWATCEPDLVGINFVSREFYRANTRGFEISLADLCALVLLFMMWMRPREYRFRWRPPLTLATLAYLVVGLLSWMQAGPPLPVPAEAAIVPYPLFEVGLYPLFELFKILRGFVVFLVIVNFVRDEASARAVLIGIAMTAGYMGVLALKSRYLDGVNRVKTTLGHPNSLATYMAMMGTFVYAFVLQRRKALPSLVFGFLTLLAGVAVILTISRGGLAAFALGVCINTLAFLPRHFSAKNVALLALGAMAAAGVLFVSLDTLLNRFTKEQSAAEDLAYRGLYNAEAKLMARDRTLGVGLGNFSAWSWHKYAAEVDPDLPPGTPAHNNWYLTLGELGRPGVVVLAILWIRFFAIALPLYVRKPRGPPLLPALAIAATTSILVDHLQSCLQLGYRQTPMYFLMNVLAGLAVAAWYAEREARATAASAARAAAG